MNGYPLYRMKSPYPKSALMPSPAALYLRPHILHVARSDVSFAYSLIDGELLSSTRMPYPKIVNYDQKDQCLYVMCAGKPRVDTVETLQKYGYFI